MSIFSDNTKNEILMCERFNLSNFSYDSYNETPMSACGDPLTRLYNSNWEYPSYMMDQFEPKYWRQKREQFMKVRLAQDIVTCYYFNSDGFTSTCDYDRLMLQTKDIIKEEYLDENKLPDSRESFLSTLIRGCLRHAKVDELFTPEIYGPDSENDLYAYAAMDYRRFMEWPPEPNKYYMNYRRSAGNKMINMMMEMINPDLNVGIKLSINYPSIYGARLWFSFDFISYKKNPMMWWYIDRSHNWHISNGAIGEYNTGSFGVYMDAPSGIYPRFDVFVDINIPPSAIKNNK